MWVRIRDELLGRYCGVGDTPAQWSADKAAAEDIAEYAADIQFRGGQDAWGLTLDSRGWVPGMAAPSLIHVAAQQGRAASLLALVRGGASVELRDPNGRTALEIARARRDAPCVRALGSQPDWGDEEADVGPVEHVLSGAPSPLDGIYQGPPPGWKKLTAAGAAASVGPITPAYSRSLDIFGI